MTDPGTPPDFVSPVLLAAELVLGSLETRAVPGWAAWWIVDGVNGPAVCRLAGLPGNDPFEVRDALAEALDELGVVPPTLAAACKLAFTDRASRCLRGEIDEHQLVCWIESVYISFGYADVVLMEPLGSTYGVDDEWVGGWGRSEQQLREAVRASCADQLQQTA